MLEGNMFFELLALPATPRGDEPASSGFSTALTINGGLYRLSGCIIEACNDGGASGKAFLGCSRPCCYNYILFNCQKEMEVMRSKFTLGCFCVPLIIPTRPVQKTGWMCFLVLWGTLPLCDYVTIVSSHCDNIYLRFPAH